MLISSVGFSKVDSFDTVAKVEFIRFFMTFVKDATLSPLRESFQQLAVDDQLALFWFVYKEMGDSVTPAAPGASTVSPAIADSLFDQVKEMSHEEQLELQRSLIRGESSVKTREYGSMSDTTKLLFWYRLAQGMESSTIVPMPPNYDLPKQAKDLLNEIKNLDFNQQITLFRDIVSPMGAEPKGGSDV